MYCKLLNTGVRNIMRFKKRLIYSVYQFDFVWLPIINSAHEIYANLFYIYINTLNQIL